jgi:hypothetical protein
MRLILLLILLLLVIGALPTWPYSTGWGYYPEWAGSRSADCLAGNSVSLATGETEQIGWRANPTIDRLLTHTLWRNGLSA